MVLRKRTYRMLAGFLPTAREAQHPEEHWIDLVRDGAARFSAPGLS
jgi:hypothetical protein